MQISTEGKIGIGLALIALGGTGALVVAPPPWGTVIGWGMIVIAGIGVVMLLIHHFRGADANILEPESTCLPVWQRFGVGLSLVSTLIALFFITHRVSEPTPSEKLPGFSWYNVINIIPEPRSRRQYIFDWVTSEGARAAFFLDPSGRFVFDIADIHGSSYQANIALGRDGIPVGKFILLICQIGVGSNYSFFHVIVNGKEVQHRDLSFPIDLGRENWDKGNIGSDLNGENNANFEMAEMVILAPLTMDDDDIKKLTESVRARYKIF